MNLGAHSTKRDAGEIDFRAVHVAAKVAAYKHCRPVFARLVMALTRRHGPVWARQAQGRASRAQESIRENPGFGRGNP